MSTVMMLDTPEAQMALGRCYALLRKWGQEACEEAQKTAKEEDTIAAPDTIEDWSRDSGCAPPRKGK